MASLEVQQGHGVRGLAVRACPYCMVWHPVVEEEQVPFVADQEEVGEEQKSCASCQDCSYWGVVLNQAEMVCVLCQHLAVRIDYCYCQHHPAVFLPRLGGEEQLNVLQNPAEEIGQMDLQNYPWHPQGAIWVHLPGRGLL